MLSAVIFDFDGVIVDSEPMHFKAFNHVIEPIGLSITWEEYCSVYIGFDDRDAFKAIYKAKKKKLSSKDLKQLISDKANYFQTLIKNGDAVPLPGAIDLIKAIPVRLPVGLCSGALLEDIQPILEGLGIANSFNVIVTAEDTPKSKPDPAPYKLALEKLNIQNAASALAIEDTPAGIESAKSAGMKVLAVSNSYDREYLMDADSITDSLEKVTRLTLEDLVL